MQSSQLEQIVVKLIRLAATELPKDVKQGIEDALLKETDPTAKKQLGAILENIRLSKEGSIPMCQDTGILTFYVSVGAKFPLLESLSEIISNAVRKSTKEIPLRPNTVDPLTRRNPGNNTGAHVPWINWNIVEGSSLEISVLPKGGGSENACQLAMLEPHQGLRGMKKFVVDAIIDAGGKPCPPLIIGVGIGGGSDICLKIAKEQLLRPLGRENEDKNIAKLEKELLTALNSTAIGPMGLGGDTTVLGVHIDMAMRHPASFPVGVAIQCWAARRATAIITEDGKVTYSSHEVENNGNL